MQKSHPKVVNPRDIAGERKKKKKKTRPRKKTKNKKQKTKKHGESGNEPRSATLEVDVLANV